MGEKYVDISGETRGKLTILERYWDAGKKPAGRYRWKAICECGSFAWKIDLSNWRKGLHVSCGCNKRSEYPDPKPGDKINSWTVQYKHKVNFKNMYHCLCECGNESDINKTDLTRGNSKRCVDCGHRISRKDDSAFNVLIRKYKKNAQNYSREWLLSNDEAQLLFFGNCHYCNTPPSNMLSTAGQTLIYNGIDRMDNDRGYVFDNVVSCCGFCNMAKRGHSYEEFVSWIDRLVEYKVEK